MRLRKLLVVMAAAPFLAARHGSGTSGSTAATDDTNYPAPLRTSPS